MSNTKSGICAFLVVMVAACVDEPDGVATVSQEDKTVITFETAPGAPQCSPPHLVAAAPGEEGQWSAVRFGPMAGDYRVFEVAFMLRKKSNETGTWCAGNAGPYKLRLFSGAGPTPTSLALLRETIVPAGAVAATEDYRVVVPISNRIPVSMGHYLYVAVEAVGDPATDTGYNCIAGCGPQSEQVNWWSERDGPPYSWVSFASVGLGGFDVGMKVRGWYL